MHQSISLFQQFWRECQSGTPAEVILGSPKMKDCKNFGICRVSLEKSHDNRFCDNKTAAYLRVDPLTGRLLIHFLSCSFNTDCAERFFQTGNFRMDEDYFLSKEMADALSLDRTKTSFYVEKGNYPILIDDHFHTVSLRLSNTEASDIPMALAA